MAPPTVRSSRRARSQQPLPLRPHPKPHPTPHPHRPKPHPQLGAAVFAGDRPKDFKFITEAADRDDTIRTPASANISDEMRRLIPLTPEWTFWPDYDRVGLLFLRGRGGRGGRGVFKMNDHPCGGASGLTSGDPSARLR